MLKTSKFNLCYITYLGIFYDVFLLHYQDFKASINASFRCL